MACTVAPVTIVRSSITRRSTGPHQPGSSLNLFHQDDDDDDDGDDDDKDDDSGNKYDDDSGNEYDDDSDSDNHNDKSVLTFNLSFPKQLKYHTF